MRKLLKWLMGSDIQTPYPPIKAGFRTLEAPKISFNDWAHNIHEQLKQKHGREKIPSRG